LSMSGLTIYFTPEETAVRALEAGADLLLKPTDADAAVRGLQAAVQSGRITEQRLDVSVRKVLAAKYDLGLKENRFAEVDVIDRVVGNRDATGLAREIAEHAITLVRHDLVLPVSSLKAGGRIFNLAITNGDDRLVITNPFVATMNLSGFKLDTVVLDDRSSEKDIESALERAEGADVVI